MLTKDTRLKLKSMSQDELYTQRDALKKEQMDLRFQAASAQLATPHKMKIVQKDIARVETELAAKAKKETK